MKRLGLALATFVIWGSIASTYYVCIIRGLCAPEEKKEVSSIKAVHLPTPLKKDIKSEIPLTDSISIKETKVIAIDTLKNVTADDLTLTNKPSSMIVVKEGGLNITYQNELIKSYTSNFRIYKSNDLVRIPLGIRDYGTILKQIMQEHNAELTIIGHYNEFETDATGVARAEQIRKLLYAASFPRKHIHIRAEKAKFKFNSYVFRGGIHFEFKPIDSIITFKKNNI